MGEAPSNVGFRLFAVGLLLMIVFSLAWVAFMLTGHFPAAMLCGVGASGGGILFLLAVLGSKAGGQP